MLKGALRPKFTSIARASLASVTPAARFRHLGLTPGHGPARRARCPAKPGLVRLSTQLRHCAAPVSDTRTALAETGAAPKLARAGVRSVQRLFGEPRPLDHVRELLVGDVPASCPETAVRVHRDALRPEQLRRVDDPGADARRRLDEVRVDVEHAEAHAGRVLVLCEEEERLVARPAGPVRAELV